MLLWLLPLSDAQLWRGRAPSPPPHVSTWQPHPRHRWIHGCWLIISRGGGGSSLHCTCQTPPPAPDWLMTELSSLLSLSLSSWALCDGGNPCKWSWCTVRKNSPSVKPRQIDRPALHSDCSCIPFRFGYLSLTSTCASKKLTPPEMKKHFCVICLIFFPFFYINYWLSNRVSLF